MLEILTFWSPFFVLAGDACISFLVNVELIIAL